MLKKENVLALCDGDLLQSLLALSNKENQTTVEILFHLAEVERRNLHLKAGYSSLFNYCTAGELKLSEPAAHRRISSARLVARYPDLVDLLLSKELSISTLSRVAGVIDDQNKNEVIAAVKGKSRRGVEEFLACFRPSKSVREVVKPIVVPVSPSAKESKVSPSAAPEKEPSLATFAGESRDNSLNLQEPITEKRYQLSFSVSIDVQSKLERAKELLSGKYPRGARLEDVLEEALEALLEKKCPERRAARRVKRQDAKESKVVVAPQATQEKPTRHITPSLRDQVFLKCGGSCAFVGSDGKRCSSRHDLEVHHLKPFAKGGENSLENLSLRCRRHNLYQAQLDFGEMFMAKVVAT